MTKKKKQSEHARTKIAHAQHRNEFMRRLERICKLINPDAALFNMFTPKEKEVIYTCRGASAKIVAALGCKVPRTLLDEMSMAFNNILANKTIELIEGTGLQITMSDFWNVVISLESFVKDNYAGKEYYADFLNDSNRLRRFMMKAMVIKDTMALHSTNLLKCLYDININLKPHTEDFAGYHRQLILTVTSFEPEKKLINIDGQNRTITRVAWTNNKEIRYLSIPAGKVDKNSGIPNIPVPVYIQQHAADRLWERISVPFKGLMYMELAMAVMEANVIRNSKDELLLTYSLSGKKVGYLLIDLINGILLIRTFLFLTNNGTPEGQKLEQLTGLTKLDKEYLDIDNMDGLVHSDILENEEVCSLFRKTGCGSLLEACNELKNSFMWELMPDRVTTSISRISNYLKAEETGNTADNIGVVEDVELEKDINTGSNAGGGES
ncbi:MAG: hypothetical protein LBV41_06675 [Cytophagaceae bacterium]|nr:hypothetical protein [Cytophagaceae bacterium]